MVQILEQIYEGKAKKVYRTGDSQIYSVYFKDDATAFNGLKKGQIKNKGYYNNQISAIFFELLERNGIPTHLVEVSGERTMLVKSLEIIKVEVVVRNIAAGSLAKRLGKPEGYKLPFPVLEYYYKNDELGDPFINDYHIRALELASPAEMKTISELSLKTNEILADYLTPLELELVDFKLEFGRHQGQIILGDEISPDTCRFWDAKSQEKLDKDRFRRDLGNVEGAYQEIYRRLTGGR